MGYRKPNYRRRPRKLRRPRKTYRRKTRAPSSSNFAPLGNTQACRLRYSQTVVLDPTVGHVADYVFRANDCTAPSVTGVTHQPYGFDHLMNMYTYCTVVGSKISATTSAQATPVFIGVQLKDNAISLGGGDINVLKEQPGNKFRLIGEDGAQTKTVSRTFSAKKFFSDPNIVGETDYASTSTTSAANGAYYHVLLAPLIQTVQDVQATTVSVTIDYYCVFTKPIVLAQS